jgi:hypothetical protein
MFRLVNIRYIRHTILKNYPKPHLSSRVHTLICSCYLTQPNSQRCSPLKHLSISRVVPQQGFLGVNPLKIPGGLGVSSGKLSEAKRNLSWSLRANNSLRSRGIPPGRKELYTLTLQKKLDRILQMHGNIACHMQCHLAFAKCDWICSAEKFIAFCKCEVTSHVTCDVTAHSQNAIQLFL